MCRHAPPGVCVCACMKDQRIYPPIKEGTKNDEMKKYTQLKFPTITSSHQIRNEQLPTSKYRIHIINSANQEPITSKQPVT